MRVAVNTLDIGATNNVALPSGEHYYYYILIHVDDLVVSIHKEYQAIQDIGRTYQLNKYKRMGLMCVPPDMHIGAHMFKHRYPEDYGNYFFYVIYSDHYLKNVITNVQKKLMGQGMELDAKQLSTFITGYLPNIDTSSEPDQ